MNVPLEVDTVLFKTWVSIRKMRQLSGHWLGLGPCVCCVESVDVDASYMGERDKNGGVG